MKTRTIVLGTILGGGLLFVVAIASCGGFFYYMYKNADKEISPKIDSLFAAIDNGTFGDTYATETTPEMRQATSKQDYEQLGRLIKNRLGHLQSKMLVSWNSRQFNADTTTSIVYAATFEKGPATIEATFFKQIGGEWRVQSFRVNSPLLTSDMASENCPHCGKPVTPEAKFCPNCGKEITKEKVNAEKENSDKEKAEKEEAEKANPEKVNAEQPETK